MSRMTITPISRSLNGTIVSCFEGSSSTESVATTTIYIIGGEEYNVHKIFLQFMLIITSLSSLHDHPWCLYHSLCCFSGNVNSIIIYKLSTGCSTPLWTVFKWWNLHCFGVEHFKCTDLSPTECQHCCCPKSDSSNACKKQDASADTIIQHTVQCERNSAWCLWTTKSNCLHWIELQ